MTDPALLDHRRWLGFIQPIGLVVSPPALLAAQAILSLNIAAEHRAFLNWVWDAPWDKRLNALTGELEREPARIREMYAVRAARLEPMGLVYLWTVTG